VRSHHCRRKRTNQNTGAQVFMTIDDELILALLKPEKNGKVGNKAPITYVVRALPDEIEYKLEELDSFDLDQNAVINREKNLHVSRYHSRNIC
jgi:hypothetical protein